MSASHARTGIGHTIVLRVGLVISALKSRDHSESVGEDVQLELALELEPELELGGDGYEDAGEAARRGEDAALKDTGQSGLQGLLGDEAGEIE